MKSIRTAVLLSCPLVRDAFEFRLKSARDIQVLVSRRPTVSALRTLNKSCDVAVVEIDVSIPSQIESLRLLTRRRRWTKFVMFSPQVSDLLLSNGIDLGFRGYLTRQSRLEDVVKGIRRVAGGGFCFCREARSRLLIDPIEDVVCLKPNIRIPRLTGTQLEVLCLLSIGHSTQELAEITGRSEKSIESVKYQIMNKTGLRDRVSLARYAIREGLVEP